MEQFADGKIFFEKPKVVYPDVFYLFWKFDEIPGKKEIDHDWMDRLISRKNSVRLFYFTKITNMLQRKYDKIFWRGKQISIGNERRARDPCGLQG
jgi:hypothetical protein